MNLTKRISTFFLIVFLPCCLISGEITEAGESSKRLVRVEGYGPIFDGNIANARDRAIQDALRQAVEQTIGTMISSLTRLENDNIEEEILSRTSGYIESYQVDEGKVTDKNTYLAMVSAVVKVGELEKNLKAIGLLREQMGNPRIMVLFRAKNMTRDWNRISPNMNIAEISLMNEFLKHDDEFNFVDRSRSNVQFNGTTLQSAVVGNMGAAMDLCHTYHVDYLILGETEANVNQVMVFDTAIDTAQASVSAKVVRASTGQIVASDYETGQFAPVVEKQAAGAKAIDIASKKLGRKLMSRILEHWRKEVTGTHNVIVTIKNVRLNDLSLFEVLLKDYITGITKVDRMEFNDGKAVYQVKSHTNANQIGEEVDGQRLGNTEVQVVGLANGRVELLCK
jgi:hypothetical protein